MSGGIAYVWDRDGDFHARCNKGTAELFHVDQQPDIEELKRLINKHAQYTESTVAKHILTNWNTVLPQFVKVYPVDYRRVIEEAEKIHQKEPAVASQNHV
jgi:glutamate synthase domain-containing protein 3